MSILEIITAAVSVISLPLLVVQVHLAARGIAADHLRRKQQATLEYLVVHLRTHFSADLRSFTERFGDADLGEDDLARLGADSEANALVVPLLGSIEHLAVGVNMGVYDQELLTARLVRS